MSEFVYEDSLLHAWYAGRCLCLYKNKAEENLVCLKVETSGGKVIKLITMPREQYKAVYERIWDQYSDPYNWSKFDYQLTNVLTGFELFGDEEK